MSKLHPPKRIYVEVWPDGSRMTDAVHYEPTGSGEDFFGRGESSRIVVYERVPQRVLASERRKSK